MKLCDLLNQWTIILSSIAMLCLTSLDALSILSNSYSKLLSFLQIIGSGSILGYSVLLGMSNFQIKSIDYYKSGIKINNLYKKIKFKDNLNINELLEKYESIIYSSENHNESIYKFIVNVKLFEEKDLKNWDYIKKIYYCINNYKYMFHYLFVMLLSLVVIVFSCYTAWMSIYEK